MSKEKKPNQIPKRATAEEVKKATKDGIKRHHDLLKALSDR